MPYFPLYFVNVVFFAIAKVSKFNPFITSVEAPLRPWLTEKPSGCIEDFPALPGQEGKLGGNSNAALDPAGLGPEFIKAFSPEKALPKIQESRPSLVKDDISETHDGNLGPRYRRTRRAGRRVQARKASSCSTASYARAPTHTAAPKPAPVQQHVGVTAATAAATAAAAAAPGLRIPAERYNLYGRPGEYQMFGTIPDPVHDGSAAIQNQFSETRQDLDDLRGADAFTRSIQVVLRDIRGSL